MSNQKKAPGLESGADMEKQHSRNECIKNNTPSANKGQSNRQSGHIDIFTDAKHIIIASPVRYFPDGEMRNGEWWFRRRADDHTPSCHILPSGACKDFGDSSFRGSCLDVYAESRGISAEEAAKEILGQDSVVPAEKPKTEKYKKPKPVIPIPPEALRKLNGTTKSDYARKKHGTPAGGWKYHMAEGEVCFCVVRYERPGKKEIIPYYYGEDSKFHEGQALKTGRPPVPTA